jgi:hypothetical protein
MKTRMLARKTTQSIDDKAKRWEGEYPKTITLAECYISSIDFFEKIPESYYAIELFTKFETRWMHLLFTVNLMN